MANELIAVAGTPKTLEASGASITSGSVVEANDATYGIVADGSSYPDADFVLTCAFASTPTDGGVIALYARPMNVDGTADTEAPDAVRANVYVGAFVVNNTTSSQTIWLRAFDVPFEASYYLHNVDTGQTVSSGWVLKATPRTVKPA